MARAGCADLCRKRRARGAARDARGLAALEGEARGRGRVSSVREKHAGWGYRMKRNAVYPGTFDPITTGHHDLVRRAASIFDRVVVAIAANPNKTPMFSLEKRVELAARVLVDEPNVQVLGYSGLTVEFAKAHNLTVVIRGLRAVSDFEFEC